MTLISVISRRLTVWSLSKDVPVLCRVGLGVTLVLEVVFVLDKGVLLRVVLVLEVGLVFGVVVVLAIGG